MTAPTPAVLTETPKPIRIWPTTMPFKKDGMPNVSGWGATSRHVVIMDADDFKRLVKEPGLATQQWEVAAYE